MLVENCRELKTAKEVKYTMVNLHNEMLDYPLETSQRENYNDTNKYEAIICRKKQTVFIMPLYNSCVLRIN